MTKFTEGSWYISKPKGEHRAFILANGCNLRVATVAYNSGKCHVNSNAALIAAAPDMYEALSAIVECWDGPLYRHEMLPNIEKARKALAKARNE